MGTGIIVCGLNGAGKSTLGKALAERLDFHFVDIEDLYFPKTDAGYAVSRTREEVEILLRRELGGHDAFVFSAVHGNYGEDACFRYAVLLEVPKEIRMRRIRERSFQKFGGRMLPGGDLYEQEESFFAFAAGRAEDFAERWVRTLRCPVLRVDGTRPVAENVDYIITRMFGGGAAQG